MSATLDLVHDYEIFCDRGRFQLFDLTTGEPLESPEAVLTCLRSEGRQSYSTQGWMTCSQGAWRLVHGVRLQASTRCSTVYEPDLVIGQPWTWEHPYVVLVFVVVIAVLWWWLQKEPRRRGR